MDVPPFHFSVRADHLSIILRRLFKTERANKVQKRGTGKASGSKVRVSGVASLRNSCCVASALFSVMLKKHLTLETGCLHPS